MRARSARPLVAWRCPRPDADIVGGEASRDLSLEWSRFSLKSFRLDAGELHDLHPLAEAKALVPLGFVIESAKCSGDCNFREAISSPRAQSALLQQVR